MSLTPNQDDQLKKMPRIGPHSKGDVVVEEIKGQDLAIVLSRFEIGTIDRILDYRGGSRQSPKLIVNTSLGRFLLKRRALGKDALEQVVIAHSVQEQLAGHRFPVAGLIHTIDGETIVEHEGRVYELFKYIQGSRFDKTNPQAAEAGRVLAHFHDLLRTYPKDPSMQRRTYHVGSRVYEVLDELKGILQSQESESQLSGLDQTIEYLTHAYQQTYDAVERVELNSLPQCVVHGDWHPGNMLYKDDEIIAVIDFDSIRYSPRITDIANGALQFSMRMGELEKIESWGEGFRGRTIRTMVQSYNQFTQHPLLASELAIVPHLMIEALIVESIVPIQQHGKFGTIPGSSFLKMVEQKVKWLTPRIERVVEVIQPLKEGEDSFG